MLQFLTQSDWTNRIGWALVHSLWQFALLAFVAFVLQQALTASAATTRYAALLAVLAVMVVVPLTAWLWRVPADTPAAATRFTPAETGRRVSLPLHRNFPAATAAVRVPPPADASEGPRVGQAGSVRVGLVARWAEDEGTH